MNADLQELIAHDPEARALVEELRGLPASRVAAGFSARVMAQIQAERHWLSAPVLFAAAASLVALLAVASIFTRPVPRADYSAWGTTGLTVRLSPYHPAHWYFPLVDAPVASPVAEEPLCTLKAVACLQP